MQIIVVTLSVPMVGSKAAGQVQTRTGPPHGVSPGSRTVLPPSRPLRTGQACFQASGSSRSQAFLGTGDPVLGNQDLCASAWMPTHPKVGSRTSGLAAIICSASSSVFVHPSRTERPDGSQPACAWRNTSYPRDSSAAFASSVFLSPHRRQDTFQHPYPDGSDGGFPCSTKLTRWGRSALDAGG